MELNLEKEIEKFEQELVQMKFRFDEEDNIFYYYPFEQERVKEKGGNPWKRIALSLEETHDNKLVCVVKVQFHYLYQGDVISFLYTILNSKVPEENFTNTENIEGVSFCNDVGEIIHNFLEKFSEGFKIWLKIVTRPDFEEVVTIHRSNLIKAFMNGIV